MKTRDSQAASMHRAMQPAQATRVRVALAAGLCLAMLTACSHMPWHKQPAKGPQPVSELVELGADGGTTTVFPQYWKRNTLVVDLTTAASNGGQLTLKAQEGKK